MLVAVVGLVVVVVTSYVGFIWFLCHVQGQSGVTGPMVWCCPHTEPANHSGGYRDAVEARCGYTLERYTVPVAPMTCPHHGCPLVRDIKS